MHRLLHSAQETSSTCKSHNPHGICPFELLGMRGLHPLAYLSLEMYLIIIRSVTSITYHFLIGSLCQLENARIKWDLRIKTDGGVQIREWFCRIFALYSAQFSVTNFNCFIIYLQFTNCISC